MYKKYKLSDLVKIKYGKNQKKVVSKSGAIPIYGTGGLMGYATKYLYNKPSVLIGRKGSIGKVKYVEHPFWTVDTLFYTEVNNDIVIPRYLFYKMSLIDLNIYNEGTTIPSLRTETLNRLVFKIPSIKEQLKIINIIKPLDDKIELNNKINKNLEEMAQAIFKSWFVDFEPWGGEMPDDWEYGTLGDYCSVKSGYAFKSASWTKTGVKVVKIKNITSNNNLDINNCSYVSEKTSKLAKDFLLNEGDIIIAMTGATIGKFAISPQYDEKILVNQRVGKFFIEGNSLKKIPFLYCCLKQEKVINEIINRGQGSAQPNISASDILSIPQIIPSEELLNKFNDNLSTIIQYYLSNLKENRKLINLRDTLLPKLMSGELDVSNLEI